MFGVVASSKKRFEIYETWDFSTESLGTWDTTDMNAYWTIDRGPFYNTAPTIANVTINGTTVKALKIPQEQNYPTAEWAYSGLQVNWELDDNYQELYYSFNIMLEDYVSSKDLKIPGFEAHPSADTGDPAPGEGFRAQGYIKYGGEIHSYFYDRTYDDGNPLTTDNPHSGYDGSNFTEDYDIYYLIPNVWYNYTLRLRNNTTPSGNNARWELAVNGVWINQLNYDLQITEDVGAGINGACIRIYMGGPAATSLSPRTWYAYVTNIKTFKPLYDDTWDSLSLHDDTITYHTPNIITDRDLTPDSTITTQITITSAAYSAYTGLGAHEQYLIDAGEGNQVRIDATDSTGSLGGGDFLFVYSGNTSDATLLKKYNNGSISSADNWTSAGRYMYLVYVTDAVAGFSRWTFDITHV
jgi:hypothetical protein